MAGNRNLDAFTAENLSRVSAYLIRAFREGAHDTLLRLAALAGVQSAAPGAAFSALIKAFHPDRIRHYKELILTGDIGALPDLAGILHAISTEESPAARRARHRADAEAAFRRQPESGPVQSEEETDYDEGDFDEIREREWIDADEAEDAQNEEGFADFAGDELRSFVDAVKLKEYGSLDVQYTPGILRSLEGMLDLSDFEIDTLEGAEYCENVEVLNISGNRITDLAVLSQMTSLRELYAAGNAIESLEGLTGLSKLRVLDVAGNQIEDLSVLPAEIEVLNIAGNPVPEEQKEALRQKGVIVID